MQSQMGRKANEMTKVEERRPGWMGSSHNMTASRPPAGGKLQWERDRDGAPPERARRGKRRGGSDCSLKDRPRVSGLYVQRTTPPLCPSQPGHKREKIGVGR